MRGHSSLSSLGSAIRGKRLKAGLTQAQLAERASISRATLIKVESGARFDVATLMALVKALGFEVALTPRSEPALSMFDGTEEL